VYGGNYDFYKEQKKLESEALNNDIKSKQQALRKAKETERESVERQQKLDARGKKKQEKAGAPRIALNTLRNNAEKSTSRIKEMHGEKINDIAQDLNKLRNALPDMDKIKLNLDSSNLHIGKVIIDAETINFNMQKTLSGRTASLLKLSVATVLP
jgi:ATPase subunit of ABC transporter with duplicated ATPase domains